jgi:hypothetical protein
MIQNNKKQSIMAFPQPTVSWSNIRLITAKLTETPVTTPISEQQPKVRKI